MSECKKILAGVSGGVDSAYSVSLLKDMGYDVTAAYLYMNTDTSDPTQAMQCAKELDVPFVLIDCTDAFENAVISDFVNEYTQGRTPNPCVVCNRFVKIDSLVRYAKKNGFDKIATGHYADVRYNKDTLRYEIYMGKDAKKDQSYMLWRLTQEQLSMLIFPLYAYEKSEVRSNSKRNGLSVAEKKDSLDICFIPDGDYAAFLHKKSVTSPEGCFLHKDGRFLGKNKGIIHYTIGQRRGLGIAADRSVYVTDILPDTNTVVVDYEEGLYTDRFTIDRINFISACAIPSDAEVKIRYAAKPIDCKLFPSGDGNCAVVTEALCKSVTPGQSAVFYDGSGRLLFGGYIVKKG